MPGRRAMTVPLVTEFLALFLATENPISPSIFLGGLTDGNLWNDIQTAAGKAFAARIDTAAGGDSDCIAVLRRSILACTANQFSEGTFYRNGGYSPSGTHEGSLLLDFSISTNSASGLECYINTDAGSSLVQWNGPHGDFTLFGSVTPNAPADGDVFRLERVGTAITVYQNGGVVGGGTDPTGNRGGNPGFGNNPCNNGNATVSGMGYTRWRGGNL